MHWKGKGDPQQRLCLQPDLCAHLTVAAGHPPSSPSSLEVFLLPQYFYLRSSPCLTLFTSCHAPARAAEKPTSPPWKRRAYGHNGAEGTLRSGQRGKIECADCIDVVRESRAWQQTVLGYTDFGWADTPSVGPWVARTTLCPPHGNRIPCGTQSLAPLGVGALSPQNHRVKCKRQGDYCE